MSIFKQFQAYITKLPFFNRLAWKLALFTGLLVILIVLALSLPVYWLTRNTLEDQLTDHLAVNITNFSETLDKHLVDIVIRYPELQTMQDSLDYFLRQSLQRYPVSAIYILDDQNILKAGAGNRIQTIQSILTHSADINKARRNGIGFAPLYKDDSGKSVKSVYKHFHTANCFGLIIGMEADAQFLKYTEQLRRRIVVIGLFVLAVSVIAVLILSQTLTKPLRNLTEFARKIGRGRADPSILRTRQDEIGFLGKTMLEMQHKISKRENENKELIASVAHEIRNPLAGMQVNTELLLEATSHAAELHAYAKAVAAEIENLSTIVENFLAYARPLDTTLEHHSLRSLIEESIGAIRHNFPDSNIKIHGDATARVNAQKIRHVFFNLLKNACEAAPAAGPITVRISKQNDLIAVAIENPGDPIPETHQSQIFEAFFSSKATGVGLGLSIAKSIMEQHGGTIRLAHSDNRGTEFVIELPAG